MLEVTQDGQTVTLAKRCVADGVSTPPQTSGNSGVRPSVASLTEFTMSRARILATLETKENGDSRLHVGNTDIMRLVGGTFQQASVST